jgi:hypothetical protein
VNRSGEWHSSEDAEALDAGFNVMEPIPRPEHSSGQWSTAAFSTRATLADPHPTIDRPGTCSPYERCGVDALTLEQQQEVRPLLQEHHDNFQPLLDKNPKASRQELAPQIHAISDETHRKIHALLTDHQKELERAMVQSEHRGQKNR